MSFWVGGSGAVARIPEAPVEMGSSAGPCDIQDSVTGWQKIPFFGSHVELSYITKVLLTLGISYWSKG